MEQWNGFKGTKWKEGVDTRDFIQNNYTEYRGDDSFLEYQQKQQKNYGMNCKR